jgi:hypothetical protein
VAALRRVVYATEFDDIAGGIFGQLASADHILRAVEWTLARETTFDEYPIAANVPGGPLRAFKTLRTPSHPACIFLFTVESETVYLHSVITASDEDTS